MQKKIHLGMRDMALKPYHWRSINGSFLLYDEPTILLLPGANINMPKLTNGSLKIISHFVNKENSARLIGAYYDKFDVTAHKTNIQYEVGELSDTLIPDHIPNKKPIFYDYCLHFFNQYFKNIFYDGNRICSVSEIQNRLKNITITAHCYGSLIAFEIERLMLKEMREMGFSNNDCLQMQQSLTIVNFASRAPIGQFKSSVIHILSSADDLWLDNWKYESFYTFFQNTYLLSAKQTFYNVSDSVNGSLLSFSENEILFFVPRVNLESGREHRVSSYIITDDKNQKITKNVRIIDAFTRLFVRQKRADALYNLNSHIMEWKNTPEGHIFCMNGQRQMQEYQGYLKKCHIGRTILHQSVKKENIKEVDALINYWNIPINLYNADGELALLTAVQKQNSEIVRLFLDKMTYNEIMNIHDDKTDKLFFRAVLNSNNNSFIQSVYNVLMKKNNRWCLLECQPLLQEYCLKQMQAGKNIIDILPCVFDLNDGYITIRNIVKMAHFYQNAESIQTTIGRKIRNEMLKLLIACPKKEILFERNEKGQDVIAVLKSEGVSSVFVNTVISVRKNYIQKLITEKLPYIINQTTNNWTHRSELSKLLCVFPEKEALKEMMYLNKTSDYIMFCGMKSGVAQRINNRLNKRYTHLLKQIILKEAKQRIGR